LSEHCLRIELHNPTGSFSPDETCNLRCQSRLIVGEEEIYFKIGAEKNRETEKYLIQ